jgi:hypothetical protein
MRFILLLGPALLAGTPVDELVSALDDESIEVREKAAAGLVALGEPALPALRSALEKTRDAETRGRIEDVLHRLETGRRRREFRGGEAAGGLCAALRLREEDPSTLRVQVEFMNVGEERRSFAPIRWWNLRVPGDGFVSNLSEALLEVKSLSGQPIPEPRRRRL